MSEETKNIIVPKLRFPQFKDEWMEKTLEEVGKFVGGGTPDTSEPEYWDGEIQWFTPTEVKERYLGKSKRTITEKGLKNSSAKLLPKGALLITSRATIGDVGIAINECTTNQGFQSLIVNSYEVNTFWYYWIVQNRAELVRKSSGSTFPEIGKNEIIKVKAFRPAKKEQQKIADCLSSLDELITSQSQKLEALQAHKKGLMQQLFPAEGETVPKRRFEEFRESGEWRVKTLEEIADIKRGAASLHLKYVEDNNPLSIRLLRINDFMNNEAVYVENTDDMKRFRVQTNDILIAGTGATAGITFIIPKKFDNLAYSYNAPRIRVKNANKLFVYHYLKSDSILWQQKKLFVGNAQPFLDTTAIGNFKLFFPSPEEQQKIANCLSSSDELITAQTEKIEELKRHKKGLMQGLFPNIND